MNYNYYNTVHNFVLTVGRITPSGVSLLGTCVLLNKPGLFATAAHVVSNDDSNLVVVITNSPLTSYQDTTDNQVKTINVKIKQVDPFRDLCILSADMPVYSNINITGADKMLPGQQLVVCGFPHCPEGRKVLTHQTAVVGAKVLIEASGIKSKHIILNIQARTGQSGSPIFAEDGSLIALLIGSYAPTGSGGVIIGGIDPQTLHQTTHAISSEYLLNMI